MMFTMSLKFDMQIHLVNMFCLKLVDADVRNYLNLFGVFAVLISFPMNFLNTFYQSTAKRMKCYY